MKAFVINEDQIKNSVLLLAGALLSVFILGYYLGSLSLSSVDVTKQSDQHINPKADIDSQNSELVLDNKAINPELNKADKTSEEKRSQLEKETLAKKELAKKELAKKEAAKKELARKEAARKAAAKKELARKEAEKKAAAKKELARKEAEKKAAAKREAAKKEAEKKEATSNQLPKSASESEITNTETPDELEEVDVEQKVYSIQAGMFASEANANSFIDKLSAKQFDAYVSSFMSSSGTTKFNVRVGRFAEREQARLLLKEFQKSFSSPAYVVITR